MGILQKWSPLNPLKAIPEERSAAPGSLPSQFGRRGVLPMSTMPAMWMGEVHFSLPIELHSWQERTTCQNRVRREYRKC
jgi:hypothetical protein